MRHAAAALVLLLVAAAPALANGPAAPHPFGPQDLLAMQRLSEPKPSPAGDRVVFAVGTLDRAADKYRTDLWIVGGDGEGLQPAHLARRERERPRLVARRADGLLPLARLRQLAGLAGGGRAAASPSR